MTAPSNITPLTVLAASIVSGDLTVLPPAEWQLYDIGEWRVAAQSALDGDASDLSWMIEREAAYQDFNEWVREWRGSEKQFNPREDVDFGDWYDRRRAA